MLPTGYTAPRLAKGLITASRVTPQQSGRWVLWVTHTPGEVAEVGGGQVTAVSSSDVLQVMPRTQRGWLPRH